jgi:glucose-6-phosphate 1-dehydrogenase
MTAPVQVLILGASGDLTVRKLMPALASMRARGRPTQGFSVLGVSRRPMTDEEFRAEIRAAMPAELLSSFDAIAPNIGYQSADVSTPDGLGELRRRADALPGGADAGRLVYFALAPRLFAPTIAALAQSGLLTRCPGNSPAFRRAVVEKPFGHDFESAEELNRVLHDHLGEDQIYRIDHYLGKETVQNLIGFRFHNAIFEPLWNRHHVELVQITVAEDIGVPSGRARYYDGTGALRDMLQNHMLQILALVAMEPPSSLVPEAIRDQKVAVLRGLHGSDPEVVAQSVVRARYAAGTINGQPVRAYADEEGIPPGSDAETYVAVRAEIDTWRWSGVPFLLRHGKRLPTKVTEVRVQFRTPPLQLFNRPDDLSNIEFRRRVADGSLCQIRPNVLTLSLQPREAISLSFGVKTPGAAMVMSPAHMTFDYRDHFGQSGAPAYERLLLDAINGDPTLFLRSDEIEASWRYADQVRTAWTEHDVPLREYEAGTWGPPEADDLFYGCEGGWSRG